MRKMGVFLGALLVCISCYAASVSNLGNTLKNATKSHSASSIIYGGQDISRTDVAAANENIWKGDGSSIG